MIATAMFHSDGLVPWELQADFRGQRRGEALQVVSIFETSSVPKFGAKKGVGALKQRGFLAQRVVLVCFCVIHRIFFAMFFHRLMSDVFRVKSTGVVGIRQRRGEETTYSHRFRCCAVRFCFCCGNCHLFSSRSGDFDFSGIFNYMFFIFFSIWAPHNRIALQHQNGNF